MWLSIVIPLYNCETYLPRCLDSILRQGIDEDEYEVLIINDGSSDAGPEIAKRYCEEHQNFVLVDQQNAGVGAARNHGIALSRGQFIEFIDADDYLLSDGLKTLKTYIDFDAPADVYTFWPHTVDMKYDPEVWEHITDHKCLFDGTLRQYGEANGFGWSVWSQIFSADLLKGHNIKFTDHKIGEDMLFMARVFEVTDARIVATNLNIYRYFVHNASVVNTRSTVLNSKAFDGYLQLHGIFSRMAQSRLYSPSVYESVLRNCQNKAFIRMISGADSLKSLKQMRSKAIDTGVLPINQPNMRSEKLFNLFTANLGLLYPLSVFYRYIFLPYIKPRLGRN